MLKKEDWHRADIMAEIHKKGTTFAALSREAGLCESTLSNAIYRPWAKGEKIIADKLGVHPSEIWPSRYFDRNGCLIERKRK